jgi:hypothetical protein
VTEPRPEESLNGADAIAAALRVVHNVVGPDSRRVYGVATVEADRMERDLRPMTSRDLSDDTQLGARCRLLTSAGALEIVLLEPITEGRIAASLARFDEGAVAVYVLVPVARFRGVITDLRGVGLVLSAEAPGPFGRQRLVAGSPAWGAHLLIAEDRPIPSAPGAGTIER